MRNLKSRQIAHWKRHGNMWQEGKCSATSSTRAGNNIKKETENMTDTKEMTVEVIDGATKIHWTVRLVPKGGRYGLNQCLTHNKDDPLIEFYDGRFKGPGFTEFGQFVSRYNASTLRSHTFGFGLRLHGDAPNWAIEWETLWEAMCGLGVWQ